MTFVLSMVSFLPCKWIWPDRRLVGKFSVLGRDVLKYYSCLIFAFASGTGHPDFLGKFPNFPDVNSRV